MIDLETLGTKEDAVVISIGVVLFDLDKKTVLEEFYAPLDAKSQIKRGRKVDPDTLKWWMGQSDAAKKVFNEKAEDPAKILQDLSAVLDKHRPLIAWGNGSTFDISIMENMYNDYGIKLSWHYTRVNCFRTFRRLVGNDEKVEKNGVAHNALDDARAQVEYMFKHYNKAIPVAQMEPVITQPVTSVSLPLNKSISFPQEEVIESSKHLSFDYEGISDVIIESIELEAKGHVDRVVNSNTTEQGRKIVREAYLTGAHWWAAKFEANSKKTWDLVSAFKKANLDLMGKDLTVDLIVDSMQGVRDALEAIVGKDELDG
jgi:hypothetical protein